MDGGPTGEEGHVGVHQRSQGETGVVLLESRKELESVEGHAHWALVHPPAVVATDRPPPPRLGACVSVPASPRASGACVRAVCPGLTGIGANPPPCVRSLLQLVISGPVPQSPHAALPPGFYPHIHTQPLGYGAVPAHPAAHPALPTHPGHTFLSGMGFPFRPIR